MRRTQPSAARAEVIRARQDPPKWGSGYVPGQLATREEAPDYSRPSIVLSPWLGRKAHLMSEPELFAYLLASYMGKFFELHESPMMHPEPSDGFLMGCPGLQQTYVGAHQGTILAAERLGLLQVHPVVRAPIEGSKKSELIAFPMLADQLYFRRDEEGVFGINWCIKSDPTDFEQAFKRRAPSERFTKSDEDHRARLLIEAELFRDAGIRTVHVSAADIPLELRCNLRMLYPYIFREPACDMTLREDLVQTVIARMPQAVPLIETIRVFAGRYGGAIADYSIEIYKAIWSKEIECDLLRAVVMDAPLYPVKCNIDTHFASWCARRLA